MILASYAVTTNDSQGRVHAEETKDCYLEDRKRIINSVSFRRLEYKTQVLVNHAGDHYRTRLTHTLEVAQVAKTISRALNLNEDLTECIALAHDMGHPPFGHAGEDAINEVAEIYGTFFDHNLHTLKILNEIEQLSASFRGLNLTRVTLDGLLKHNGPILEGGKNYVQAMKIAQGLGINAKTYPSLEAQVAALADDIAYCAHDLDDGIRAGFIDFNDIENLKILKGTQLEGDKGSKGLVMKEVLSGLYSLLIGDLIEETSRRIKFYQIDTLQDVYSCSDCIVEFSPSVREMVQELKSFLMARVYRNYKICRMSVKGQKMLKEMFEYFMSFPKTLPTRWQTKAGDDKELATVVKDYLAGMTDRFAIEEYAKLFQPKND